MIWLPPMLITLKTRHSQFVPENTPYSNYWLYLYEALFYSVNPIIIIYYCTYLHISYLKYIYIYNTQCTKRIISYARQ